MKFAYYMSGDEIISIEEDNPDFHILLKGEAMLVSKDGFILEELKEGDYIGEFSLNVDKDS